MRPKEFPGCSVPHLLTAYTWQLEILVTVLAGLSAAVIWLNYSSSVIVLSDVMTADDIFYYVRTMEVKRTRDSWIKPPKKLLNRTLFLMTINFLISFFDKVCVYRYAAGSSYILRLNLIFLGFGVSFHLVMYYCDWRRAMVMYIILWRESFTTNNTYYFLLHFFLFPLFQRIRDASVAIIKRALAILQLFAIRWGWITLTISIVRRQGLLSFKLLIVCVLHFADQCSVFLFSVSLVVLENRYKTRLYRKLHLLLCLDTCKWPCFCLSFPVWKVYLILVSGHFARRQFAQTFWSDRSTGLV